MKEKDQRFLLMGQPSSLATAVLYCHDVSGNHLPNCGRYHLQALKKVMWKEAAGMATSTHGFVILNQNASLPR